MSELQAAFMREVAANFIATRNRLLARIHTGDEAMEIILNDELRGLYHGLFVIFDGGSALADQGLIAICDQDGKPFDRFLHEICFEHWPEDR